MFHHLARLVNGEQQAPVSNNGKKSFNFLARNSTGKNLINDQSHDNTQSVDLSHLPIHEREHIAKILHQTRDTVNINIINKNNSTDSKSFPFRFPQLLSTNPLPVDQIKYNQTETITIKPSSSSLSSSTSSSSIPSASLSSISVNRSSKSGKVLEPIPAQIPSTRQSTSPSKLTTIKPTTRSSCKNSKTLNNVADYDVISLRDDNETLNIIKLKKYLENTEADDVDNNEVQSFILAAQLQHEQQLQQWMMQHVPISSPTSLMQLQQRQKYLEEQQKQKNSEASLNDFQQRYVRRMERIEMTKKNQYFYEEPSIDESDLQQNMENALTIDDIDDIDNDHEVQQLFSEHNRDSFSKIPHHHHQHHHHHHRHQMNRPNISTTLNNSTICPNLYRTTNTIKTDNNRYVHDEYNRNSYLPSKVLPIQLTEKPAQSSSGYGNNENRRRNA
ncbi:hypothetical protein SNEBB_007056 [Seison nebaliae]|nr:hypothetical protein SNEBB_007056 [Seison nebaliae]